jgi:hypothetical protein
MYINITSEEKDRIGLTGTLTYTTLEFGITLEYCDMEHSRDLYNLLWRYKVQDKKRFMTAVIKYGIKYKNVKENR